MKAEKAERYGQQDHRLLALWAADCAEHVLPLFEAEHARDHRPREAIESGRAWARDEKRVSEARAAAVAAHTAARGADGAARAAARAAGHAAATAHMAGHARHAAAYAARAMDLATESGAIAERQWQRERLPAHLRPMALPPGA